MSDVPSGQRQTLGQRFFSWRRRAPLHLYLLVWWPFYFGFYFVSCVLLAVALPMVDAAGAQSPQIIGPHFWTVGIIVAIAAATYTLPWCLIGWYDILLKQFGRSLTSTGCAVIPMGLVFPLIIVPGARLMSNPKHCADVLPIHWNQTQGKLLSYRSNGGTMDMVTPDVTYVYTVAGQSYTSSGVNLWGAGNGTAPVSTAEAWKKQVGQSIPVYYDSAAPELSVLIVEPNNAYRWLQIFYLILALTISGLTALSFRKAFYREMAKAQDSQEQAQS